MSKVYVFGSLNMDMVIRAPREVLQGETVTGSGFMTNPGGKGANQAVACGKLGAEIMMGGAVGADGFGKELLENLQKCNVNTDRIDMLQATSTGVAVIVVTNGDNRIILDAGANGQVTTETVDNLLQDARPGDYFLTQLENPIPVIGYALKIAKAKGMITVLNPAPMNPEISAYLGYCDMIVPNEHEFYDLTGTEVLCEGAKKLHTLGVKYVIVTLGSKGYCCCGDGKTVCEDCIKQEVVDTTAAGDTFCGGMVTRLSLGDTLEDALHYANRAASITVTRRGAQQAIPWKEEVK